MPYTLVTSPRRLLTIFSSSTQGAWEQPSPQQPATHHTGRRRRQEGNILGTWELKVWVNCIFNVTQNTRNIFKEASNTLIYSK